MYILMLKAALFHNNMQTSAKTKTKYMIGLQKLRFILVHIEEN
jgi:hypothetical protein